MDLIDHVEVSSENAALLFAAFRNWYEDRESGFDEGIYDEAPTDDDRIAYEFATGVRRDLSTEACRLPAHAAIALDAGISSYLDDLETGLADGTYDQRTTGATSEALADLQARIEIVAPSIQP